MAVRPDRQHRSAAGRGRAEDGSALRRARVNRPPGLAKGEYSMSSEPRRGRAGRRAFLRTSATAGVGLAIADSGSGQSALPRELFAQLSLIDLSVSLEHDAAGERTKPRIEYVTHEAGGLKGMMDTFGAAPKDF